MSGGPDFDRPGPPAEIEKIRQETDRKIEALLTPEQLKEYQKIVKERDKERPGPGHGQGMGGPPPEMGNRPQF